MRGVAQSLHYLRLHTIPVPLVSFNFHGTVYWMMDTSKTSLRNGLRSSRKCFYCVSLVAALLLMFCQNGQATAGKVETTQANRYPIVLLHGFTGWGRDEMAGFKYWGGITDLQLV